MKNSLKYSLILFIVAATCALAVAGLFTIVDPIIALRTEEKVEENLNLITDGQEFTYKAISADYGIDGTSDLDELYEITYSDGTINYVYQLSPQGRNADIIYLIAYDVDGKIVKIQYVQMRETKGRGDRITKEPFLESVYSQNASQIVVETISGATYSSTAMKNSIEASAEHLVNEVLS